MKSVAWRRPSQPLQPRIHPKRRKPRPPWDPTNHDLRVYKPSQEELELRKEQAKSANLDAAKESLRQKQNNHVQETPDTQSQAEFASPDKPSQIIFREWPTPMSSPISTGENNTASAYFEGAAVAKLSRPFGQVDPEEELREFQRREALRINLPQVKTTAITYIQEVEQSKSPRHQKSPRSILYARDKFLPENIATDARNSENAKQQPPLQAEAPRQAQAPEQKHLQPKQSSLPRQSTVATQTDYIDQSERLELELCEYKDCLKKETELLMRSNNQLKDVQDKLQDKMLDTVTNQRDQLASKLQEFRTEAMTEIARLRSEVNRLYHSQSSATTRPSNT